eukprot:CAMPEP_0119004730 /NCGR_PEP_ID=MMETSP1176-20130426/1320_1 /TAXON_ID=265551 /ORGANISM="Synedropsis recta cf, Strain CCMP1620" /LENGTH=325 /DNA_ID=CAMNT_0006956471 /DNA_START=257 /DNA_END=1234 /DNA_ORIENTATION=-
MVNTKTTASSTSNIIDLPKEERKGILVLRRCGLPISTKEPPPVYLLISGFPDPPTTFDSFVQPFEERYHVVKIGYPGMEDDELPSNAVWGYSLKQIHAALVTVLEEYRDVYHCNTIMLHGFDWGAMITLGVAHSHPHLLTKLVQQDIGQMNLAQMSRYNRAIIVSYQLFLATLFCLSRLLSFGRNVTTTVLSKVGLWAFPWFLLMKPSVLAWDMLSDNLAPHKCYPYLQIVLDNVIRERGERLRTKFAPTVPQLFAYSDPHYQYVSFFTDGYLTKLKETLHCQVKSYPGTHWLHINCQEELQRDVMDFFLKDSSVDMMATEKKEL